MDKLILMLLHTLSVRLFSLQSDRGIGVVPELAMRFIGQPWHGIILLTVSAMTLFAHVASRQDYNHF